MNLRRIHAFLIFMSAALAVLFGLWCLSAYQQNGGLGNLLASIGSFAASFGLLVYDSWFLRKTRMLQ